jgi:hypothetical protein
MSAANAQRWRVAWGISPFGNSVLLVADGLEIEVLFQGKAGQYNRPCWVATHYPLEEAYW